jgi:hypothetical protein
VHRSTGEQRKTSKKTRSRSGNARQAETGRHEPKNMLRSVSTTNGIQKPIFPFKSNKITPNSRMSPPSLPHLIYVIKIEFVAHFYSRKYKMKLKSGRKLQPFRVIYIGSSKKLNDYYAHRA